MAGILWGIIVLLVAFWIAGLAFHVAGGLIHILLVVALALVIFNVITGRSATA